MDVIGASTVSAEQIMLGINNRATVEKSYPVPGRSGAVHRDF